MKTTTTLLIAMVIGSITASAQTKFGITAGATYANMKFKSGDVSVKNDYKLGFTAGVFADMTISKDFSFQPALNFTQKGTKDEGDGYSDKTTLNYLEVPLNFVYSFQPGNGLFIGAGPSIAFGLSGQDKWEENGNSGSDDINFGSGQDEVKVFELGANFMAGYKMKNGFLVSAGYNLGLTDISNYDDNIAKGSVKSNYFSLKVGWTFHSKTK
jgi:hypothetical protein